MLYKKIKIVAVFIMLTLIATTHVESAPPCPSCDTAFGEGKTSATTLKPGNPTDPYIVPQYSDPNLQNAKAKGESYQSDPSKIGQDKQTAMDSSQAGQFLLDSYSNRPDACGRQPSVVQAGTYNCTVKTNVWFETLTQTCSVSLEVSYKYQLINGVYEAQRIQNIIDNCLTYSADSANYVLVSTTCTDSNCRNITYGLCVKPLDTVCTFGTYNPSTIKCESQPTCSSGNYNSSTDRCEISATTTTTTYNVYCTAGYTSWSNPGSIFSDCSNGVHYNGYPSVSCTGGNTNYYNWVQVWYWGLYTNIDYTNCQTTQYSCPSGYTLSGTTCYASATCSGGTLNTATDRCETTANQTCLTGILNSTTKQCETTNTGASCPTGFSYNSSSVNECPQCWNESRTYMTDIQKESISDACIRITSP